MYGETLDLECQQRGNGKIKCPIGKSMFTVNLPSKLFRFDISDKSLQRPPKKNFVLHASEI